MDSGRAELYRWPGMKCRLVTWFAQVIVSAVVPWTAAAEAAEASPCATYSLGEIDNMVAGNGLAWSNLVQASMRRVRPLAVAQHFYASMF